MTEQQKQAIEQTRQAFITALKVGVDSDYLIDRIILISIHEARTKRGSDGSLKSTHPKIQQVV
jgi:hypothetical protein